MPCRTAAQRRVLIFWVIASNAAHWYMLQSVRSKWVSYPGSFILGRATGVTMLGLYPWEPFLISAAGPQQTPLTYAHYALQAA